MKAVSQRIVRFYPNLIHRLLTTLLELCFSCVGFIIWLVVTNSADKLLFVLLFELQLVELVFFK